MNRRTLLTRLAAILPLTTFPAARGLAAAAGDPPVSRPARSREDWRPLLGPAAFAVLFEEDTERPFSSPLNSETRAGTYLCAACHQPLFSAAAKYDSGTGWPSFRETLPGALNTRRDFKLIYPRTEYHCSRCGGHQGHVFDDGPPPTGKRYCNNGLALRFIPTGESLPELR